MEAPKRPIQSSHLSEEVRTEELARTVMGPRGGSRGPHGSLMAPRRKRSRPRGLFWALAGLGVFFVAAFAGSYFVARQELSATVSAREGSLRAGVEDLRNLDLASASKEFSSNNVSASGWMDSFASILSGGRGAFGAWDDLSRQMFAFTQDLGNAEQDLWGTFAYVSVTNGAPSSTASSSSAPVPSSVPGSSPSPLVGDLTNIRTALGAIDADMSTLSGESAALGAFGIGANSGALGANSGNYLALKAQLGSAEQFLDAFIPWFGDTAAPHHVLVLLENPSEMRPGGGFLGSYADVSVRGGAITGISVYDIADVDAAFAQKIIPPVPLQLEEKGWRPADGNWFFDFPTSASATISLFESSALYADASTTFDAAIALTPRTIEDILSLTGPVSVPDAELGIVPAKGAPTSTMFSADNLTEEIQSVVQAGQANRSRIAAPKSVIGFVWKDVLSRLASSTAGTQQQLLGLVPAWIANKDVMIYSNDGNIENFLRTLGAAGDEFRFPQDFNGDYLAIANTDVNSDKSERYVSSTISWTVSIGAHGTATDHVAIVRTHHGDLAPRAEWWYRTTNQDYIQVMVPAGSTLDNEKGGFIKKVPAPIDYAKGGYSSYPLLAAIQSSTVPLFSVPGVTVLYGAAGGASPMADPGKTVFSVWDRTYLASTTEVAFDYSHPLYAAPADGMQYEFVLERPSGAAGEYKVEIDAPLGYVFAENGLASFLYDSTSTPGRLVFDLTLQKI